MLYLVIAAIAALVSFVVTPLASRVARRMGFVDEPFSLARKQHARPTPLGGGVVILLATASVLVVARAAGLLPGLFVTDAKLTAVLVAGSILVVGGLLDDRYRLRPALQIIFPVLAAAIAVAGGIVIPYVRSPFGGILTIPVLPGAILTFLWLLGMMYTTKFLDGLDGLVAGMGIIAASMLAALSLRPELNQADTALLAVIFDGALVGFLIWNFYPAKVFLGEGGSTFIGFMIGALAVAAGSKVATTLLVLGIPILDVGWTIVRRFRSGRPLTRGDREHLHFRLIDAGLTPRRVVFLLWSLAAVFGLAGLVLDTRQKVLAFAALVIVVAGLGMVLARGKRYA